MNLRPSPSASGVTFVTRSTVCILSLVYLWPGAQFCISKRLVAPPCPPPLGYLLPLTVWATLQAVFVFRLWRVW